MFEFFFNIFNTGIKLIPSILPSSSKVIIWHNTLRSKLKPPVKQAVGEFENHIVRNDPFSLSGKILWTYAKSSPTTECFGDMIYRRLCKHTGGQYNDVISLTPRTI
jgi:hypothetical protein